MTILFLLSHGSLRSPEHLVPDAASVSCRRLQAPAAHHAPDPNRVAEYGSSSQSAIINGFRLSAIFGKTTPRHSRCRAKSP